MQRFFDWFKTRPMKCTALAFIVFCIVLPIFPQEAVSTFKNGDFEESDISHPGKPRYWDMPDGLGIIWTLAPDEAQGTNRGKAIRMDTSISEKKMVQQWKKAGIEQWDIPDPKNNPIAATYGLSFYSDPFPVEKGKSYRIAFDFKGPKKGEGGKVWVRGYGEIGGKKRRLYETVIFCRVPDNRWHPFSQSFHPTKYKHQVTEVRVMLFACWPAGVYWFDNVKLFGSE